jgi:hypothetical protein
MRGHASPSPAATDSYISRQRAWLGAAALLALLAWLGLSAGAAGAAGCGHEAIRLAQGATWLPDCRGYEMVSPVSKNGGEIVTRFDGLATDGNTVGYGSNGVFAGAQGGVAGTYRAQRGDDGWETVSVVPPFVNRNAILLDGPELVAGSDDFGRALFLTTYPVDPRDQGSAFRNSTTSEDLYRRNADGTITWVSAPAVLPDLSSQPVAFLAKSRDLSRVLMSTNRVLAPSVPDESVNHLYLYGDGQPTQLVDVDPEGNPVAERPPATQTVQPTRMSADGSRVAFMAGSEGAARLYIRVDADDPALAGTLDLGLGTAGRTCTNATLLGLSADGTKVVFRCPDQLTDDPIPAGLGEGLYLRDVDTGSLRLLGADLDGQVLGGTPDFSSMYFSSLLGLAPDGTPWNAVVMHVVGGTAQVAVELSGFSVGYVGKNWVSPNGRFLAFSTGSNLGYPNAGYLQAYRYDSASGELDCVSCPADGSPATGEASVGELGRFGSGEVDAPPIGAVSDDGEVFFSSFDPLLARDQNGTIDAYAWRDGQQHLLSSGRDPLGAMFYRAAPGGRDVFIITPEALAPQDVDGGGTDIYDVRAGGGFPVAPPPSTCSGELCQGAPPPPPTPAKLATADFAGAGNATVPRGSVTLRVGGSSSASGPVAKLRLQVPTAGRVSVAGASVRRVNRAVGKGASVIAVRLDRAGRATLRKQGTVRTKLTVVFRAPVRGVASKSVQVTFRQPGSGS